MEEVILARASEQIQLDIQEAMNQISHRMHDHILFVVQTISL